MENNNSFAKHIDTSRIKTDGEYSSNLIIVSINNRRFAFD
jgi:hypothetical protein